MIGFPARPIIITCKAKRNEQIVRRHATIRHRMWYLELQCHNRHKSVDSQGNYKQRRKDGPLGVIHEMKIGPLLRKPVYMITDRPSCLTLLLAVKTEPEVITH